MLVFKKRTQQDWAVSGNTFLRDRLVLNTYLEYPILQTQLL